MASSSSSLAHLEHSGTLSTTTEDNKDENEQRGNWSSKVDFLLSAIGFAVGLGNIWRFPFRAYQNGGASFLIPYVIILVFAGLPLFFLELALGQFSSLGPISVWKLLPLFKGVGWAMMLMSFIVAIYYNMIIAYILRYLFASFTTTLPWQSCRPEWIQYGCYERLQGVPNATAANTTVDNGTSTYDVNMTFTTATNLVNRSHVRSFKTPSEMYWEREVLALSEGIDVDTHVIKWDLALCLLFAWIFVFFCVIGGVKSVGKVVYVTAIVPYVVLFILFIWNIQLEGAWLGIRYYLIPDWKKLGEAKVWYAAGTQIFYSLGTGFGILETMGSYNRFQNNVYRDSVIVSLINCATSVFGGFVIFSVLGFMSVKTGVPVKHVATDGPGLAFIAYPEGIAMMPLAPLWSVLFFVMLFTLGVDSQFGMLETGVTALVDEFDVLRRGRRKVVVVGVVCIVLFIIGLPQCSPAGLYVMTLFDWYSGGLNVIIVALFEVCGIAWIYGFNRFSDDIAMMIGHRPNVYWIVCWVALTPVMTWFLFVFTIVDHSAITLGDYVYPDWADGLGWLLFTVVVVMIPLIAVIELVRARRAHPFLSLSELCWRLCRPTFDWGPALAKFRTGRYALDWSKDGNIWTTAALPRFADLRIRPDMQSVHTLESFA